MAHAALIFGAHPLLVDGIEHKIKRRLEPLLDLGRVGHEGQVGRDQADDRDHRKAGNGAIGIGLAENADMGAVERQLLLGLAQGGFAGILAGVDAAAGEGDLAGVGA